MVSQCSPERSPQEWLEDMQWHRRMFAQSRFRWVPEDATHIFLAYTRGRCLFETPAHLRSLDAQQMQLREWAGQIQDAMAQPLRQARGRCPSTQWGQALDLIGLSSYEVRVIVGSAITPDPGLNRDVKRALRGIPLPNPLSQVWELRQMHSMYRAADNMMEDTLTDLVLELVPRHGWDNLAALTVNRYGNQLRQRVEHQREERGKVGDPRRAPAQRY